MKIKSFVLIFILALLQYNSAHSFAQPKAMFSTIETALQKSDFKSISSMIGSSFAITINGKTKIYSNTQGISVLNNYFKKNKANSFKLLYQGNRNSIVYGVGEMIINKKNTDVLLLFKYDESLRKYLLNEIKFE